MAEPGGTRRAYLEVEAVNPADGKRYVVLISHARVQALAKRSVGQVAECAYTVPAILQRPIAIFEGLRQDEDEDRGAGVGWRCYCGVPEVAYRPDGSKRPVYPGQVFLVFVNEECVAYNWRWEKTDEDDANLPSGYAGRFRKRVL